MMRTRTGSTSEASTSGRNLSGFANAGFAGGPRWLIGLAAALALAAQACAGREAATVAVVSPAKKVETCSLEGNSVVVPLLSSSSSVALAKMGPDTVAIIADEDARRVYAVDIDSKAELGSVDLEQAPSNLIIAKSGRVAVTLPGGSVVEVLSFDGKNLSHVCAVPTDSEPVALALTPDERTLLVTSGWGHSLAAFKSADMQQLYRVDLPREPRAVVISDDGTRAFVSHALGSVVSAIDLGDPKPASISLNAADDRTTRQARQALKKQLEDQGLSAHDIAASLDQSFAKPGRVGSQGFALAKTNSPSGRILVPQVLVDPGRAEQRTQGYGQDDDETQVPNVAVLDAQALRALDTSLEVRNRWARAALVNGETREECVLPRGAAVDPTSGALLVTCMGSDLVLGLDSGSAAPADAELFRVRVATGPTGIAVDAAHGRAVVWSQFERVLQVLKLPQAGPLSVEPGHESERIALSKVPAREPSLEFQLGRRLFFASGDPRIAKDGRACASCHINGRDDGLVWATPNGPRRTKVLAGLVAGTAPYSWDGEAPGLRDQVGHTFERLRGVGGLRGIELTALLNYVSALPPPPAATEPEPASSVERGALVFASKQAGCAECHTGIRTTDGHLHDVATRTDADRAAAFDTPSLDRISGRAPYFHDGRYATLRELLEKSAGKMGQVQPLPAQDLDALESFLRTL